MDKSNLKIGVFQWSRPDDKRPPITIHQTRYTRVGFRLVSLSLWSREETRNSFGLFQQASKLAGMLACSYLQPEYAVLQP